jgi:hypothetical protein
VCGNRIRQPAGFVRTDGASDRVGLAIDGARLCRTFVTHVCDVDRTRGCDHNDPVTTIGFTALALGALSGFRHAFEPDHLAAVSTLVTERPGPARAAGLGAWWGLGHTLALGGVAAVLTVLDLTLPTRVEQAFELAVALMLCALGVRAIRIGLRQGATGPWHLHTHWFGTHTHASPTSHVHVGAAALAPRPLLIGIVHGLAGSGAVTALVMTALPTAEARIAYTILFGVASMAGMALVSGLAGMWLSTTVHSSRTTGRLSVLTGAATVLIGTLWGFPILREWIG